MPKLTLDDTCEACGLPFREHVTEHGIDAAGKDWVAVEMCNAWMIARYPEPIWDEMWTDPVTGLCVLCGQGYSSHWEHGAVIVGINLRGWLDEAKPTTRIAGSNAVDGVDWRLPIRFTGCRTNPRFAPEFSEASQ